MSGHYLEITANVNGRGAVKFSIPGGGQFLAKAREAQRERKALSIPVVHPQALTGSVAALARNGWITFPADSIRDVRMG